MGTALIVGIAAGALTAAESFISSEATRKSQQYQADVYAANADAYRSQAELTRQQGEVAQNKIDDEKTQLRRDYNSAQGQNTSLLAAGNVVLDSGSALDTLTGNADLFAADVGENRYNRQLAGWEAENSARQLDYQGDVADAQSSWLNKTAGSLGMSLLSGVVSGGIAGVSSYMLAGGTFGTDPTSSGMTHVFDGDRTNPLALGSR
ncbi:MAG: hypothetical protein R3Y11_03930 [Pseudomonadota bacterium]